MLYQATVLNPNASTFGYCYLKCCEVWPAAVAYLDGMRYTTPSLPIQNGSRLVVSAESKSAKFISFSFMEGKLLICCEDCADVYDHLRQLPLWHDAFVQHAEIPVTLSVDDTLFEEGW